jgi:hypothetical protein
MGRNCEKVHCEVLQKVPCHRRSGCDGGAGTSAHTGEVSRSSLAVVALAGVLAGSGCTGAGSDPGAGRGEPPPRSRTCPAVGQLPVVDQFRLEETEAGGPYLDRGLRVTRLPSGDRCVDLAVGGADPDPDVVRSHVEARGAGQVWARDDVGGGEHPALRVPPGGCLEVSGSLVVLGRGEVEFTYEAAGRVGRCPAGDAAPRLRGAR